MGRVRELNYFLLSSPVGQKFFRHADADYPVALPLVVVVHRLDALLAEGRAVQAGGGPHAVVVAEALQALDGGQLAADDALARGWRSN